MPEMHAAPVYDDIGEGMMHKIFAYGTLRRGFHNFRLLEDSKFLGNATTAPEFTMLHLGGFPGIVRGGETTIHGEVFEVDEPTLQRLDRLEGHPNFYRREETAVTLEDGNELPVSLYVLPERWRDHKSIIPSGVWGKR